MRTSVDPLAISDHTCKKILDDVIGTSALFQMSRVTHNTRSYMNIDDWNV